MIWSIFHTLNDWHVSVAFNWDFLCADNMSATLSICTPLRILFYILQTGKCRGPPDHNSVGGSSGILTSPFVTHGPNPFLLDGGKNNRRGTKGRTDNMIIGVGYWFNFNIVSDWWCWWLLRQDEYYLEWSECTLEWQHWRFSEELIADIHRSLLFLEHTHVWHACLQFIVNTHVNPICTPWL